MCGVARAVSVIGVRSAISQGWARLQAHPRAADAALAAVLLGAAVLSSRSVVDFHSAHDGFESPDGAGAAASLAVMIAPLALRRRAPVAALLGCTAGLLLSRLLFDPVEQAVTLIVLSLAVYSAAMYGGERRRNRACALSLVAITAFLVYEENVADAPGALLQFFDVLIEVALFCAMWALGSALGAGRRRAQELLEQTVELERSQEENARRAVFDERVRIARELHDVVAHHVSVMGVQAGAARVVIERDPAKAKEALHSIERSSRQAVLELHRLLGFLRQDGDADELAPQPGLGQLDALAQSMSDAKLTVVISVDGERRPVTPTVDVSAYRIVQEALTNTIKHAGASRADVHLTYRRGELELEITDDGRGNGDTAPSRNGGGLGLIGMRERAGLHGGQLSAGPVAGGGFAVRATLPTRAAAL